MHPKMQPDKFDDAELRSFESKVNEVMKILENMNSGDKETEEKALQRADLFLNGKTNLDDVNEDNFIVKDRQNRTVINKKSDHGGAGGDNVSMDKFTFMQQCEEDANKRAEVRREQEKIAQHFRTMGNNAYHQGQYEKAINMFTKAIDHVKDSPILYNNRALCYMKLQVYRRAIIDCDFVINKLEDKNLRSWLYKAAAYFKLGDTKNFESSVKWAKKNNSKELEYIDKFVENIKTNKF